LLWLSVRNCPVLLCKVRDSDGYRRRPKPGDINVMDLTGIEMEIS
jgi:hypothetical protein